MQKRKPRLHGLVLSLCAFVGALAFTPGLFAYEGNLNLRPHAHSSTIDGGANLTPVSVAVSTLTASSATITNLRVINGITTSSVTAANFVGLSTVPAGSTLTISGYFTTGTGLTTAPEINIGVGAMFTLGPPTGVELNTSGNAVWAKSIDGASQSSGCLVSVGMNNTTPTGFLTWTSTTTSIDLAQTLTMPGVLLETCAPGVICRVGISGVYRIFDTVDPPATSFVNNTPIFTTNRCMVAAVAALNSKTIGNFLNTASGADSAVYLHLIGR